MELIGTRFSRAESRLSTPPFSGGRFSLRRSRLCGSATRRLIAAAPSRSANRSRSPCSGLNAGISCSCMVTVTNGLLRMSTSARPAKVCGTITRSACRHSSSTSGEACSMAVISRRVAARWAASQLPEVSRMRVRSLPTSTLGPMGWKGRS